MSTNQAFDNRLPSEIDIRSADQLRSILAGALEGKGEPKISVADADGDTAEVVLTHGIAETFMSILRLISSGRGFQVIPYKAELTTQQAADFLNVSRPYLIKLLEGGDIEYTKVNKHRRVKAEDLFRYKSERDLIRSNALDELAEADADMGLI